MIQCIHLVHVIRKCSEYLSPEQYPPLCKSQCPFFPSQLGKPGNQHMHGIEKALPER